MGNDGWGNIRAGAVIFYYMKLMEQVLSELGADDLKAFTVIPAFGGYFRCVKNIAEYSAEKVVLVLRKTVVTLEGEGLEIGRYFEQDIFIKGDIKVVKVD